MVRTTAALDLEPALVASVDSLLDIEDAVVHDNVRARLFGTPAVPATIGRFRIERRVGAGAMGEVFAAHDPRLGRAVAVKLLRRRGRDGDRVTRIRESMLAEARALGRVSHPHVVEVFDVGTVDDRIYIAMELVAGDDLRQWQHRRSRPWREIVDVYLQAGHGLLAAHRAGLVHRDFKPDNAIIGPQGRVRVLDFGLAIDGAPPPRPEQAPPPQPASPAPEAGLQVGTCGYMAPEQALAGMAGPHADQFGFCVALWEALYGRRPFGGNTPRDSARAVLRDAPAPGPTKAVPRGIRRALERGLRANPWERWPSLGELLGELEDQRRRPRQRAAMAASMVVVGLAAGVWIAWPTSSHCDGTSLPDPIGAWTPPRRERLGAQFESVGGTFARPTWQRVDQRIDSFVGSWQDTYRTLCARPGPLPPSDGMQACLDDHRDRFAAVLDVFEHADATTVERAVAVVGPLATVTECLDPQASRVTTTPTDDGAGPQVAQLRTALAQVAALEQSGRYDEALTRAQPLTEMAREVDAPSLLATALLRQGSVRIEAGQIDRAGPELEEAYFIALSLRDDAVTLEAATRLVHLWGTKAARFERAQSWARHAHASLSRRASPEGEAVLLRELAVVHAEKGRHPQARNYAEQALAISESLHPADDPRVAVAMDTLAGVEHRMGQFDAALEHFERAHAIRVQALGPDHPDTLLTGMRLALVRDQTGDGEQAQARFSAVLEKLEASVGPHHPAVAMVLINMGSALVRDGHLDRAVPRLERALAIRRATRFDHPHTAITMHNLGTAAAMAGHDAKAREYFEQVLGIFERTQGRGHPTVADVLVNLGRMSARSGDLEQAERQYWHAYAIYLAALGPEHISVANLLTNLARLALQRSQPELAIRHARRALVIRERELGAAHPDTVTTREILTTATRDATTDP